jgi:hypothetical protein
LIQKPRTEIHGSFLRQSCIRCRSRMCGSSNLHTPKEGLSFKLQNPAPNAAIVVLPSERKAA